MSKIDLLRRIEQGLRHAIEVAQPLDRPGLMAMLDAARKEARYQILRREAANLRRPRLVK